MKKIGVVVLVALVLAVVLAPPADARGWRHGGWRGHHGHGHGGFFFGLGVGALLTAPWWYRPAPAYAYPVYVYPPSYSYPAYIYGPPTYYPAPIYSTPTTPTPQPTSPPPSGGGAEAAPLPPSGGTPPGPPPAVSSQNCQTVWVEGHYQTRVMSNGQRITVWIPAQAQQLCQ